MTTLIDTHVEVSSRFLRQAEQALDQGELVLASEKGWAAVAQRLKAIALRRGWIHRIPKDYSRIVTCLADEVHDPEKLMAYFSVAQSMYNNIFNDYQPEEFVRHELKRVRNLLDMLDEVERSAS